MQLYRFSPIQSYDELVLAVSHIHAEALKLSRAAFGEYLPVTGTVAIFTHSEAEFSSLQDLQGSITSSDDPFNGKYRRLLTPINVPENDGVPGGIYTHLYVRRPDPYRSHVGDIDLYLSPEQYTERKYDVSEDKISGARVFPENRLDMIELYDFDSDVLAYADSFRLNDKTTWSNS